MPGSSATASVLGGLDKIRPWQEDFYRHLHQHPELSHQEHAHRRRRWPSGCGGFGYEVHEGVGGTGVVGVLRNGDGPTVLLRADMDALPVKEQTGLPYASTVTARDQDGNEVPVMHACGHDVHVTCLLGASALLADAPRRTGTARVVALFQPAEELGDGARRMVDDGLAALVGHVDVALRPARAAVAVRDGRHPARPGAVRRRQHADHRARARRARLDAAGRRSTRWCWPP